MTRTITLTLTPDEAEVIVASLAIMAMHEPTPVALRRFHARHSQTVIVNSAFKIQRAVRLTTQTVCTTTVTPEPDGQTLLPFASGI